MKLVLPGSKRLHHTTWVSSTACQNSTSNSADAEPAGEPAEDAARCGHRRGGLSRPR